ncbi:MAG: hypothetical protein Q9P44_14255, partial [Anaerolineae bacterium]|nr:hypothetical protein [Anaerolineae bacterium]
MPTDTPASEPSAESTEIVLSSATPIAESTEIVLPTIEITAEVTASVESTVEVTAESTEIVLPTVINTATESAPLLLEPPLVAILSEAFHTEDTSRWNLGLGWGLAAQEQGFALQVTDSDAPVSSNGAVYADIAVEMLVRTQSGTVNLYLRQTETDNYTLSLRPDGQVDLYHTDTLLATSNVAPVVADQWRHVRFSAIGDTLRVAIDSVEVMAIRDTTPLLNAGQVAFNVTFSEQASNSGQQVNTALVDNIRFWIPEDKAAEVTNTPTQTPIPPLPTESATATAALTPIPPLPTTEAVQEPTTIPIILQQVGSETPPTATDTPTSTPLPQWCAEFDFTLTNGSWVRASPNEIDTASPTGGEWINDGQGWRSQLVTNTFGRLASHLEVKRTFAVSHITSVRVEWGWLSGTVIPSGWTNRKVLVLKNGTSGAFSNTTAIDPYNQSISSFWSMDVDATFIGLSFALARPSGSIATVDQTFAIRTVTLNGTGTNPLPAHPCSMPTPTPTPTSTTVLATATPTATATPSATPTSVATLTPTSTPIPTLSDYGITVSGWDASEEIVILEAVQDVALAFLTFATNPVFNPASTILQPHEIFRLVMGDIQINEVDLLPNAGNGSCQAAYPVINCDIQLLQARPNDGTQIPLTKYTIVHELGHLFVSQTGGNLGGSFYDIVQGDIVTETRPLMGIRRLGGPPYSDRIGEEDWWRGDRGWGSHAFPAPSTFQQNSTCVLTQDVMQDSTLTEGEKDEILTSERDEAVTDMFLNWVYSTIRQGGFQNT